MQSIFPPSTRSLSLPSCVLRCSLMPSSSIPFGDLNVTARYCNKVVSLRIFLSSCYLTVGVLPEAPTAFCTDVAPISRLSLEKHSLRNLR
jgi:hypothetical protein